MYQSVRSRVGSPGRLNAPTPRRRAHTACGAAGPSRARAAWRGRAPRPAASACARGTQRVLRERRGPAAAGRAFDHDVTSPRAPSANTLASSPSLPRTISSWSFVSSRATHGAAGRRARGQLASGATERRGDSKSTSVSGRDAQLGQRRAALARAPRQEAEEREAPGGEPDDARAPRARADGPGTGTTRCPAASAAATRRAPGIRDAAACPRRRRAPPLPPAASAASTAASAPPRCARAASAGAPRCRGGRAARACGACPPPAPAGLAEHAQRPQRHVLEIADRRRDHDRACPYTASTSGPAEPPCRQAGASSRPRASGSRRSISRAQVIASWRATCAPTASRSTSSPRAASSSSSWR